MNHDDLHFLQEQVFAYLRGELDRHDNARFERIMLNDSRAADFVSRLDDMLRGARVAQPEAWVTRSANDEFAAIVHDVRRSSVAGAASREETSLFSPAEIRNTAVQNAISFEADANRSDDAKAEALFSAIAQEIHTTNPLPAQVHVHAANIDTHDIDTHDAAELFAAVPPPTRRLAPIFFAAAAVVLLTFGLIYLLQVPPEQAPQQPVVVADNADTTTATPAVPVPANRFAALTTTAQGTDDIRVFALPGAEWELTEGPENRLYLRQGAIFVEYIRQADETLTVYTDTFDVRVVGTVFYVSVESEDSEVGVLAGAVEIATAGQENAVLVQGGEQFDTVTGIASLSPEAREQMVQRVDPAEHEARLQQATASLQNNSVPNNPSRQPSVDQISAMPAPALERNLPRDNVRPPNGLDEDADSIRPQSQPVVEESDASALTGADDLLAAGRSAERNGEWRLAAERYEQALRLMPRGASDAATVRLDLARIYLRRLQSPDSGMQQLRTFLQTWPLDPAAASVREEFCRLVDERNLTESLCD
jgi:hypothetical protein